MRAQQTSVFGQRKEPHTIIIARGDKIRHFTIRPWMAAAAGSALAALAVGYLLATTYLVLRDDLIGGTMARQARIQQAYEDRISALRAQVDRMTSRQLLDQQFMQRKVGELIERQQQLTERQGRLGPLLERIDRAGNKEIIPRPTPRPGKQAANERAAVPRLEPVAPALAFAATARAGDPRQTPFDMLNLRSSSLRLDRTTQLFDRMDDTLALIETEQLHGTRSLAEELYSTADAIAAVLETTGIEVAHDMTKKPNVGGPLMTAVSGEVFEAQVRELDQALSQLEKIRLKARVLPLANPTPGAAVSSQYGRRRDPFLGRLAHHSGIDFDADRGAPVFATGAGRVVKAGRHGGYGRMVEIDHGNGLTSRYAHLSRIAVRKGQTIEAGTIVGGVGSSGRSTGPHLHYEVRRKGAPVNPARFLKAGEKVARYL